ncbi:hypothetical protein WFL33_21090 [Yersinia enterocolitica]
MSENTDYETLKAERDAGLTLISRLVFENAALTDKAASELSNAWLLHRAVMTIQAALHCIHGTNIYEAQCWLESIADDAELVIPPEMMLSDLQRWFDENMTGLITHAQAVEIIKAEMSATTQALNEIKARGVDEFTAKIARDLRMAGGGHGYHEEPYHEFADHIECKGGDFAASLRGNN